MDLREMYEKETGEEWEIDNDKSVFPSYNYVEWIEDMVENMKCCENCKHRDLNVPTDDLCCDYWSKCKDYSEWELKED